MKVGIIVGRFQIDALHYGHQKLLNTAYQDCDKVIVFVVKSIVRSESNPLPQILVQHSVKSNQGSSVEVHELRDLKDDEDWEYALYDRVYKLTDSCDDIYFYGGRDSYLDYLTDPSNNIVRIDTEGDISATELRNKIGYRFSQEFKMGYIKAVQDEFKAHYAVVDAIITDGKHILLGRKESGWGLIGGFADECDPSLEHAAIREVYEETNLRVSRPRYLMSAQCNDWRYKKARQPFTSVYVFHVDDFVGAKAGDDILDVKAVSFNEVEYYINQDNFHLEIINTYLERR